MTYMFEDEITMRLAGGDTAGVLAALQSRLDDCDTFLLHRSDLERMPPSATVIDVYRNWVEIEPSMAHLERLQRMVALACASPALSAQVAIDVRISKDPSAVEVAVREACHRGGPGAPTLISRIHDGPGAAPAQVRHAIARLRAEGEIPQWLTQLALPIT